MTSMTLDRERGVASPATRVGSPVDVLLVALGLGFAAFGLRPLSDPDVWWHLRTGELIVHDGFTRSDPWSHASSHPWLLHEWGSEVLMYLASAGWGYHGVIALHTLGMLVLAALLLRSIRQASSPLISVAVGLLALVSLIPGSAERPQLLSWCLLAAVVPPLHRQVQAGESPWWLIPVVWAWANLHGLWVSVLILFGALVLGRILEVGFRKWRSYRSLIMIGGFSAGAAALTPNGPRLLLTPLHVREYAPFVAEWRAPTPLSPFFGSAFLLVAILVFAWARQTRPVRSTDLALVFGALAIGLPYIRTMPIVTIVVAPMAAAALWSLRKPGQTAPSMSNVDRGLATGLVAAFALLSAVWLPHVPGVERDAPFGVSETLDSLPDRANILNEYEWGGWLLWTARDTSPAIDGRTEIYDAGYVSDVLATLKLTGDWQAFLRSQEFDAAWLRSGSPLAYELRQQGWQQIDRNDFSVVLAPPDPG